MLGTVMCGEGEGEGGLRCFEDKRLGMRGKHWGNSHGRVLKVCWILFGKN